MSDRIEIGDRVIVNMNAIGMTVFYDVEVIHVPVATGDCWVFKDSKQDTIHHFNEAATISRMIP